MTRKSLLVALLMVLSLALGYDTMALASAPQLWFSPGDDLEVGGVVTQPDFPKLFEEPSFWPTGLDGSLPLLVTPAVTHPSSSARLEPMMINRRSFSYHPSLPTRHAIHQYD
jgi:hypothetical protein